jgi:hypothetical protein
MELFSYTRFESNDSPTHPSERIAARMLGTPNGRTAVQQHPPHAASSSAHRFKPHVPA